jgi:hypothetical protein
MSPRNGSRKNISTEKLMAGAARATRRRMQGLGPGMQRVLVRAAVTETRLRAETKKILQQLFPKTSEVTSPSLVRERHHRRIRIIKVVLKWNEQVQQAQVKSRTRRAFEVEKIIAWDNFERDLTLSLGEEKAKSFVRMFPFDKDGLIK